MIRTYFDIMADTAGYSVVERSIVRFEYRSDDNNLYNRKLHGGVNIVWRHLHNIMKNTTVFEGYNWK